MKTFIKKTAADVGFFSAGVAGASPLPELARLGQWLAKDFYATMDWMRRDPESRCNPQSLLPGAKSVICCAFQYNDPPPPSPSPIKGEGRDTPSPLVGEGRGGGVARFARGPDYHKIVRAKLEKICNAIRKESPSARFKICVDTSPILEKPIAVRAGIGWQGKHSIVIHPDIGSYFVLGEIITDLEIEPDGPMPNRCSDCKKCIDACPTGAIVEPYVLDANRCLSYLTIEHKTPHPLPSPPRGEGWERGIEKYIVPGQYGCDICQQVCPFNNSILTTDKHR